MNLQWINTKSDSISQDVAALKTAVEQNNQKLAAIPAIAGGLSDLKLGQQRIEAKLDEVLALLRKEPTEGQS